MNALPAQNLSRPFHLSIPADLSCLSAVRAWAGDIGSRASLDGDRVFDLQVTVSEATANGIEHAASEVELTAWVLPDRLIVEIINDGPFRPGLVKDHDERRRGLGLPLMVSLADQVHVSRLADDKTQVSLTFFLEGYRDESAPPGSSSSGDAGEGLTGLDALSVEGAAPKPYALSGLDKSAWLVIPLIVLAMALIRALGVTGVHESAVLYATFSAVFLSAACLIIAYLAARSYRLSGSPGLLFFGSAALLFAVTYLVAGPLVTARNDLVTVHNVGSFVTAVLFVLSAVWSLNNKLPRPRPERVVPLLAAAYIAVIAFMGLLVGLTVSGDFPRFFVEGQGYTAPRDIVFGLGTIGFLVAAILFWILYRRLPSRFLYWCCAGLALIGAVTGAAVLAGATPGSALAWLSRSGQWIGGMFLLFGVLSLESRGAWVLPLERTLREVEDRYQRLVDLSPDAVLVDLDGAYVFANPAAARLFGVRSPQDLVGKNAIDYVHPDDREFVRHRVGQVLAGAIGPPYETRLLRIDGTPFAGEITRSRVEFDGRLANQVVIRDLSERKQVEEALRTREQLFHTMVDAMPQLAWMARPDGYIYWYNLRWYEYTGTTPAEMEGWGWQSVHDPEVLPVVLERWRESIATGKPFELEFPLRGADGTFRSFLTRVLPLLDTEGRVLQWFGTNTDVTGLSTSAIRRGRMPGECG